MRIVANVSAIGSAVLREDVTVYIVEDDLKRQKKENWHLDVMKLQYIGFGLL